MSLSNIFKGKKVITTNRKNGTLKVSVKDKKKFVLYAKGVQYRPNAI